MIQIGEKKTKKEITALVDRLLVYVIIGTLVGARLFDLIFYEPWDWIKNPKSALAFWEGGLASHGGVIGILIALYFFARHIRKEWPKLTWIRLVDFLVIPASFVAVFIRMGNFINQEILGTPYQGVFAITFGHPADGSASVPRHPVQLYEAVFYLALGIFLFVLRSKLRFSGKIGGLFFILCFAFRFFIEFLKTEQSVHISPFAAFSMGQYLSIPLVLLGIFFFFKSRRHAS